MSLALLPHANAQPVHEKAVTLQKSPIYIAYKPKVRRLLKLDLTEDWMDFTHGLHSRMFHQIS